MSTYSPSLRIELITTGTQAGTWGNTTNTNLGGLIESAIAGYTSVSITSANQALTALNGAPDESRNQTIALTTTTAAAFNVYAPPAEKTYVIYNASAHAATVYNSTVIGNTTAAGLGVVIPAGKTVTVWSDGTNFSFQNDHLPSLTLASPLAAASGGTGLTSLGTGVATFLETPTSANLRAAVSDETGTGSLVFATSPTLVAPALGTPSSAVLTNATGLPISTGVSGLGTGVATFLATPSSANLAAAVTDETGSGALVFATSPTLVTPALGTPASGVMTNVTGLPVSTGISGLGTGVATFLATPSSANLAAAVSDETGSGALVFATSPTLVTPALGTPSSATLTNATGLPIVAGTTGTLSVARGGTGVTTSTGTGNTVLSDSPTLVTPALGTPSSATLTNATGLPIVAGTTGTLSVARGGTGVTTSTGSGNVVLSSSPTLVTPALGTPSSATLTNATGLPIDGGTTGTLPVARGGTGVTSSTGSGNVVLSTSPTLVAPALGTPSSGNLANCSFPTLNQNTTGNAATATNPQSGGSFITSSNIGSQSVNFATTAGNGGVTSVNGQTGAVVTTTYGGIGSYVIAGTTDQPGAGEYLNAGTTVAGSTLVRYNPILADQPSYAGVLGGLQVFDNFFVARTFLEYYSESLGLTGTWRIMTSIILGTGGQGGPGGWNATNGKYLLALFVRIS